MSDYCTKEEVKRTKNISGTTDDTLLEELITQASREIDNLCQRSFYGRQEVRYFDAYEDVYGQRLMLDDDLIGVNSITNGDGTTISSSEYVLEPANATPKYAVRLLASSSKSWTFDTDPQEAISINGTWGYVSGTVPPDVIKRACIRMVTWRYEQRNAPFETRGFPQMNMVSVPAAIPADIPGMLNPYLRRRIGAPGGKRRRGRYRR